MDISTFYALFSATCFTLTGLWWSVVQSRPEWGRDPAMRRTIGGVYLSFFLPALMGLFAQVGGTESPVIWRASFVVIALVGGVSMIALLAQARGDRQTWSVVAMQAAAGVVYGAIAVLGVVPEIVGGLGLRRPGPKLRLHVTTKALPVNQIQVGELLPTLAVDRRAGFEQMDQALGERVGHDDPGWKIVT